jgi:hypothetical protein
MNTENRSRKFDAYLTTSPVVPRSLAICGIDGTNVLVVKTGFLYQLVTVLLSITFNYM